MIYVENRRKKKENIIKCYPDATILDVTSNSDSKYSQWLSPFFPHGNIPIPFTDGMTAACVEGIWQGLKVFEKHDVDFAMFTNDTMRNLKRTVKKYGKPLGHRKGAYGTELLDYFDARMLIYLPSYKWVLDNVGYVHRVLEKIKEHSMNQDVVLLDYNTNCNVYDITAPLSHAGLIKHYIEGCYPSIKSERVKHYNICFVDVWEEIKVNMSPTIIKKYNDRVLSVIASFQASNPYLFLNKLKEAGIGYNTKIFKCFKEKIGIQLSIDF